MQIPHRVPTVRGKLRPKGSTGKRGKRAAHVSFIETIERARALLERNSRLSLRALQREFALEDDALEELVEELVEIQRVAVRDGRALERISETLQQDANASEVDKAEEVLGVVLPAGDEPTEALVEPGEQAFDLPTPPVPTEG